MKDWLVDVAYGVGVVIVVAITGFLLLSAGIPLGLEWTSHLIQDLRPR